MKRILYLVTVCMTIVSCSDAGSELDRTIFIPDAENSSLPAYSEWGYNSFGAVYEKSIFVVNNSIPPFKIMFHNDSLRLLLSGITTEAQRSDKMELIIAFPCEPMDTYTDLLSLHKQKVDLTESKVSLSIGGNAHQVLNVLSGEFYFKRVQLLSVDDKENRVILSGTFELRYLADNGFANYFTDGRFDFGINKFDSY